MRAFIFSLDSFIAFTLVLVAIYSLVFFSTVPSVYYSTITQANFLAKDAIYTLQNTPAPDSEGQSLFDLVINGNEDIIHEYLDPLIPRQFGFEIIVGKDNVKYSTKDDDTTHHKRTVDRVYSSAHGVYIGYTDDFSFGEVPYGYITCEGDTVPCDPPPYIYEPGKPEVKMVRLAVFT